MKQLKPEPLCKGKPDHRYVERVLLVRSTPHYYLQCVYCGYRPK